MATSDTELDSLHAALTLCVKENISHPQADIALAPGGFDAHPVSSPDKGKEPAPEGPAPKVPKSRCVDAPDDLERLVGGQAPWPILRLGTALVLGTSPRAPSRRCNLNQQSLHLQAKGLKPPTATWRRPCSLGS